MSEQDIRKLLSTAYQQGVLNKQQLWLHENVFAFDELTAKRIMKPARIVAAVSNDWTKEQVDHFISETPYSYFPVYHGDEKNITGIVKTKNFYTIDSSDWHTTVQETCRITADTKAKDIFVKFKDKNMDFGIVVNAAKEYIGIVAMQDIMEGIFGDLPEIEDYADYFYQESPKVWIAETFIHLQRLRNTLPLPWLRDYENNYLSVGELLAGEAKDLPPQQPLVLNNVRFEMFSEPVNATPKIKITLP